MVRRVVFLVVVICSGPVLGLPLGGVVDDVGDERAAALLAEVPDVALASEDLFEGDMIVDISPRSVVSSTLQRWCNARVPYVMDSAYSAAQLASFNAVFQDFAEVGITFVERTVETNYVLISASGSGCSSAVGMRGGPQTVNLPSACFTATRYGTIHHEMMHALGFYHEQSRPDRDSYVTINSQYIQSGAENNFEAETLSNTHNTPYDYLSVMHYPRWAFSISPGVLDTISPRGAVDPNTLGQRTGLSETDKAEIREVYSQERRILWPYCVVNDLLGGTSLDNPVSAATTLDDYLQQTVGSVVSSTQFDDTTSSTSI